MNAIALPAVDGVASLDWDLDRNVANPMRSPLSRTIQRKVRSGDLWRCSLRFPLYDQDDAGVLAAWFDEVSRGDRWLYLTPPHNTVRGNWAPAELVTNGTFRGGATTGWTAAGATLSVNARRLKIKNSGAASGLAYQEITCEANKPHVLMVDGFAGNTASLYAALRLTGGGAVEQDTYFTAPTRGVLLFYPSQAAMRLHLALESTTAGAHLYASNVSVCRCLTVNGGGQTGTALNVDGGPASTNAALKVGEFVTLRVKNQWQMVRLTEDLDTDANGAGTLRFEPALRYTPVDGEAVIVRNPFVRAVMEENVSRQSVTAPLLSAYTCTAIEDATELPGEIQSDLIWAWDAENETLAPQIGTGTPTFTRAGATAPRVNAAGLIEVVAADTPRFDYDPVTRAIKGLLIEEARTNPVLWNRDLTNAVWAKSNATAAKDQTGVDGVANSASSLTATAANGTCKQAITLASSARSQTVYVKRLVGSGDIYMSMDNEATWSAVAATSAWTRVSMPTQTLANPTVVLWIVTSGDSIAVDLVQNESGTFATSPIPTTTAAVTRNADDCSALLSAISGFSSAEGSLFVDALPRAGTGEVHRAAWLVEDAAGLYASNIQVQSVSALSDFGVSAGGVPQVSLAPGTVPVNGPYRQAAAWKLNDFASSLNGGAAVTDSAGSIPPVDKIYMGGYKDVAYCGGHLRKLRLYKRRKPNQFLTGMTA